MLKQIIKAATKVCVIAEKHSIDSITKVWWLPDYFLKCCENMVWYDLCSYRGTGKSVGGKAQVTDQVISPEVPLTRLWYTLLPNNIHDDVFTNNSKYQQYVANQSCT